jgi:hypothetical protein
MKEPFRFTRPLHRLVRRPEVGFEKGGTPLVSYFAIRVDVVVVGGAAGGGQPAPQGTCDSSRRIGII